MSDKKKFKDTKVGGWLKSNAPDVLDTVLDTADDYFPPLKLLTNLLKKHPDLTPDQKAEFQRIADETYRFELNYDLEQTNAARGIYGGPSKDITDWMIKRIMVWNLWFVTGLVVVNVGVSILLRNESAILAVVSNIIGVVIGQLLAERQTAVQFPLGSSLGSKLKDIFKKN